MRSGRAASRNEHWRSRTKVFRHTSCVMNKNPQVLPQLYRTLFVFVFVSHLASCSGPAAGAAGIKEEAKDNSDESGSSVKGESSGASTSQTASGGADAACARQSDGNKPHGTAGHKNYGTLRIPCRPSRCPSRQPSQQ